MDLRVRNIVQHTTRVSSSGGLCCQERLRVVGFKLHFIVNTCPQTMHRRAGAMIGRWAVKGRSSNLLHEFILRSLTRKPLLIWFAKDAALDNGVATIA